MKILIIPLFLLFTICPSNAQDAENYRVKKNTGKVVVTPYNNSEITILRISGLFRNARKVIYLDTLNGYQAEVPKSLEIQETNSPYNFCMMIPRKEGRKNAICVNSANKQDFQSFEDFKNHIIGNPEYFRDNGRNWLWGNQSKLINVTPVTFQKFDSFKVSIDIDDRIILGQFILIETNESYLWINYVADEDTFDSDLEYFKIFLNKFELLE
ncbi:hypothetical protein G5B37_03725 [Rasiella rasia]|uniref:Uncharacterized protein n=1 Tax=Rasiella rasia TaxID=2744027 RepID=A0A6G6GLY1_9FLAO|nr:hypothetical protein [Rasiella rasia]QIE58701.1 hypothetical protein G5B37_03725 [Rasiella rasia]